MRWLHFSSARYVLLFLYPYLVIVTSPHLFCSAPFEDNEIREYGFWTKLTWSVRFLLDNLIANIEFLHRLLRRNLVRGVTAAMSVGFLLFGYDQG